MATPFPVFRLGKKGAKNGTLAIQTLGATYLKLGMYTLLDSWGILGWVSPGYINSSWCVGLKMPKKKRYFRKTLGPKDLNLAYTHTA